MLNIARVKGIIYMNDEQKGFSYTYSAPTEEERREIVSIRSQYVARSERENKMELLRRLDGRVRRVPLALSLVAGIVGVLTFGGGLALCLQSEGAAFFAAGIFLCAAGAAIAGVAKLVYNFFARIMRKKYGRKILKLTEELLGEERPQ